jgi:hypothetical protein
MWDLRAQRVKCLSGERETERHTHIERERERERESTREAASMGRWSGIPVRLYARAAH